MQPGCLHRLQKHSGYELARLKCPLCRVDVGLPPAGVSGLQKSFVTLAWIDSKQKLKLNTIGNSVENLSSSDTLKFNSNSNGSLPMPAPAISKSDLESAERCKVRILFSIIVSWTKTFFTFAD